MRSLSADRFGPSVVGMLLALAVLLALLGWFLLARIPLYEISDAISVSEGKLYASFSTQALSRIRPGQSALLHLTTAPDAPPLAVQAVVFDLPGNGKGVELFIVDPQFVLEPEQKDLKGRVEVQAETVSPLALMLRASGKFLNQPRLPLGASSSSGGVAPSGPTPQTMPQARP